MEKPTIKMMADCLMDDNSELTEEANEVVGTWRHGNQNSFVASRVDGNGIKHYWRVIYRNDPDGNYNDLRDGDLDDSAVVEVVPVETYSLKWKAVTP